MRSPQPAVTTEPLLQFLETYFPGQPNVEAVLPLIDLTPEVAAAYSRCPCLWVVSDLRHPASRALLSRVTSDFWGINRTHDLRDLRARMKEDVQSQAEFVPSFDFDVDFIVDAASLGFLPMGVVLHECVLPNHTRKTNMTAPRLCAVKIITLYLKLHVHRCCLDLRQPRKKPRRKVLRAAEAFTFAIDTAFDQVVQGTRDFHKSQSWVYYPLGIIWTLWHARGCEPIRPSVHSVEIYETETGRLVAGEIGVTCGKVYTSYTGYHTVDDAGNVQMDCLESYLRHKGFELLDFGMEMKYKLDRGAESIPRSAFVALMDELGRQHPVGGGFPLKRTPAIDILGLNASQP